MFAELPYNVIQFWKHSFKRKLVCTFNKIRIHVVTSFDNIATDFPRIFCPLINLLYNLKCNSYIVPIFLIVSNIIVCIHTHTLLIIILLIQACQVSFIKTTCYSDNSATTVIFALSYIHNWWSMCSATAMIAIKETMSVCCRVTWKTVLGRESTNQDHLITSCVLWCEESSKI